MSKRDLLSNWAPPQCLKRRIFVRSRKVSKPRDWYFKLPYRFEMWQAHRQHCCRSACQISERSDNPKCKSRGFETLRDRTERRLFGYGDKALSGDAFPFILALDQHKYTTVFVEEFQDNKICNQPCITHKSTRHLYLLVYLKLSQLTGSSNNTIQFSWLLTQTSVGILDS